MAALGLDQQPHPQSITLKKKESTTYASGMKKETRTEYHVITVKQNVFTYDVGQILTSDELGSLYKAGAYNITLK
jgi:hypothetical protein